MFEGFFNTLCIDAPCQRLDSRGGSYKMAAVGRTQQWRTKAVERESSIIKAQTRLRDEHGGGWGEQQRGGVRWGGVG